MHCNQEVVGSNPARLRAFLSSLYVYEKRALQQNATLQIFTFFEFQIFILRQSPLKLMQRQSHYTSIY